MIFIHPMNVHRRINPRAKNQTFSMQMDIIFAGINNEAKIRTGALVDPQIPAAKEPRS